MKKTIFVFILWTCFVSSMPGQESAPPASPPPAAPPASSPPATSAPPSSPPTTQNNSNIYQQQQDLRQQQMMQRQREQDFLRLQMLELSANNQNLFPENVRRDIDALYRKTNKKELKLLKVNEGDKQKYGLFLKSDKTGLVKLISDLGCSANAKVIVASENCLKYSMPGGGSSYSFRTEDYRIPQLADLRFADSIFEASGILSHGIFTGIGDIPLENVDLQSSGIKYLADMKPVTKYDEAVKLRQSLLKGMMKDGFFYGSRIKAVENMTYILRSIAYAGEAPRAVNGITYNELDFDKRKDVIVAFRIIRKEDDGSITLLWRELARSKSPKMERKKRENKDAKNAKNDFTAKN